MAKKNKKKQLEEWAEEQEQVAPLDPAEIRTLKREIALLKRKYMARMSGESLIVDEVTNAFSRPPDLVFPKAPSVKSQGKGVEEIAVLVVSDTQIGKTTSTYDTSVADSRLQMLAKKAIEITRMRRSTAKIRDLRIYLIGDMVEGEDIFPHQAHTIDSSVFEQAVKNTPAILARMIMTLSSEFTKVKVVCVPGNHGRNGPKGRGGHPKTNWDSVCYEVLRLMLLGSDHSPSSLRKRMEFVNTGKFYAVDRVFDWGNLMVHGDQITGGFAGFPWYGTAKKAWGWIDSIPEPWEYLFFGHFHTYAQAVLNRRMFLCNGTTESDNTYAQANLAAAGFPCQRFSFFNANHGLIADNQIFLTEKGERVPQRMRASEWLNEG